MRAEGPLRVPRSWSRRPITGRNAHSISCFIDSPIGRSSRFMTSPVRNDGDSIVRRPARCRCSFVSLPGDGVRAAPILPSSRPTARSPLEQASVMTGRTGAVPEGEAANPGVPVGPFRAAAPRGRQSLP
jgi:hypothetical protein